MLQPWDWLTAFCFGKRRMVLRPRTLHTRIQGGLIMVCGSIKIIRLDWNTRLFRVDWIHIIGTRDGSLTVIIRRCSGTESLQFMFSILVIDLHWVRLGHSPTKWAYLPLAFHRCESSWKFELSFHTELARVWTSWCYSLIWHWYTMLERWDRHVPWQRSQNWWHSSSSVLQGWWLEPPCSICSTPKIATLSSYCR